MYNFFLQFHSGIRWLILLAAVIVVVKSLVGLFAGNKYSGFDKATSKSFVMLMRVQFILGIVLYFFLSPFTNTFTFDMGSATIRFWSVEHLLLMFLAIGASEMGNKISGKSDDAQVKFRFQSIFFGISLILMLLGIPWNRF